MKQLHIITACVALFIAFNTSAQNVAINTDGSLPNAASMLDIKSDNKGVLIPRIALTGTGDVTTISSPALSLLVFNMATAGSGSTTVTPGYYYWDGSAWTKLVTDKSIQATSAAWSKNGNAGTTPGTDFIGTTDSKSLLFKVNNIPSGNMDIAQGNTFFGYSSGKALTTAINNVGIGQNSLGSLTTSNENVALGESALAAITDGGGGNTAVGKSALAASNGFSNTAVGRTSLVASTTGSENTALGRSSLFNNTTGSFNTAIGRNSLMANTTGNENTGIGFGSQVSGPDFNNATVVGSKAFANCSNCVILGSINGVNTATSSVRVGIGTTNPEATLDVRRGANTTVTANLYGSKWVTHINYGAEEHTYIRGGRDSANVLINDGATLGNVGIATSNPQYKLDVNGIARFPLLRLWNSPGEKLILFESAEQAVYGIGIQNNLLQIHTDVEQSDVVFGYGSSSQFNERVRIKGNGRIGIGTNDPSASLDVRRTTTTSANIFGSTIASHFCFGPEEHTYIRGGKGGSNVLINDYAGAGNVGIGTGTPS
ncbi:MAG TPA: hypothetical protein VHM26_08105, partial [Chitinophagaceae bacterium]|nr:hypothetical protein [Chitinophagaceae bacterium]